MFSYHGGDILRMVKVSAVASADFKLFTVAVLVASTSWAMTGTEGLTLFVSFPWR